MSQQLGQQSSPVLQRSESLSVISLASTQLPTITRELRLLRDDYRRHNYLTFNPDYNMFLRDMKTALDTHQLPHRVFEDIFGDTDLTPHPDCNG